MGRYVLRRVGQGLFTVLLVVSVVFILIRLAPGDPAFALAGQTATSEQLEEIRRQFGLDQPLPLQYLLFLQNLLRGDLGTSFSFGENALTVVLRALPYTLLLAVAAILLTALIAIPLGILTARKANTALDTSVNVVTIAGQSMPDFWLGVMLIVLLAVTIPLFPTSGFDSWSALVLPATTVAILQIAVISRLVKREMLRNLGAPFVSVARSRGLSESALTWRYAFGNAAIPVVTALGTRFAAMLNGVVIVEVVYSWPGVGSLVVRALETRDYPLIQATVLVTATLAVAVQLLVDLLYPLLDPRVRLGKLAAR
jgi:peptide/nickel transport system permease protein